MTAKKILAAQTLLLGAFLSLPTFQALAAGETGGGGSWWGGERTPMTVDICVQKTAKTAAECQTMIDNFKSRGQERGVWGQGKNGDRTNRSGRFGMETHRFAAIQARLDKVIAFFDSKGADTSVLESDYTQLKSQMTTAEGDFTALQAARMAWKADPSAANKTALDSTRATAKTSSTAVKTYYHGTLLPLLKTLLQSIV